VTITYAGHEIGFMETRQGGRFKALCSCGYGQPRWKGDTPPTRATETVAAADCFRHLAKVKDEARRLSKLTGHGGSPLPKLEGTSLWIGT
jgi:hypothetical protein